MLWDWSYSKCSKTRTYVNIMSMYIYSLTPGLDKTDSTLSWHGGNLYGNMKGVLFEKKDSERGTECPLVEREDDTRKHWTSYNTTYIPATLERLERSICT